MRSSLRLALLAVGLFFCLASATRDYRNAGPPGPPPPPPSGQSVGEPQPPAPSGAYFCHNEQSGKSGASICRANYDLCEQERVAAAAQGLTTTFCHQISPVTCFTLTDGSQWCSETLDDCEAWRLIDAERNNAQPPACTPVY